MPSQVKVFSWEKSDIAEERRFIGLSSFLWERKFLTQAAHLYVETPESV
jgi:hypothetical protein